MNCQEITKVITDISGFQKALDLAINKEISVKEGLDAKKRIEMSVFEIDEMRMRLAEKLFGQDFLGPKAIEVVFGSDAVPTKIPAIPFSHEELKKALSLGQFLVLRTSQIPDDKLSLPNTKQTLDKAPETKWAIVTKDLIPNTTSKNYIEQTEQLIIYLQEQVFSGKEIPKKYQEAITEFESQKEELRSLAESTDPLIWKPATLRLANLNITKLTQPSRDEILYDVELYKQINDQCLLSNNYARTSTINFSAGYLVCVGRFGSGGMFVGGYGPDGARGGLGVSFSRSF